MSSSHDCRGPRDLDPLFTNIAVDENASNCGCEEGVWDGCNLSKIDWVSQSLKEAGCLYIRK